MNLPEKFAFRVEGYLGFTHIGKVVGNKVKVKWARGFLEFLHNSGGKIAYALGEWPVKRVEEHVACGVWMIVDDGKKVEEKPLPDEFEFTLEDTCEDSEGVVFYAKRACADNYRVSWTKPWEGFTTYSVKVVEGIVRKGLWKILEKYKYPDVFHIIAGNGEPYTLTRENSKWVCTEYGKTVEETYGSGHPAKYSEKELDSHVGYGWTLYEPKKPTPEKLARNKEIQEQIEQLDTSIANRKQLFENYSKRAKDEEALIKSYEYRIEVLKKGLVEE